MIDATLEHEVRGAVASRLAEQVRDATVGQERDALERDGRARAVTTETLEAFAIAGADRDACMNVEATGLGRPGALDPGAEALVVDRHRRAVRGEAQEGAAEERHLHARLERRRLGRLVGALRGRPLVDDAAAAKPAGHVHTCGHRRDVLARRRGAFVERDGAVVITKEDAIGHDDVGVFWQGFEHELRPPWRGQA
jgi:hypothetical protein